MDVPPSERLISSRLRVGQLKGDLHPPSLQSLVDAKYGKFQPNLVQLEQRLQGVKNLERPSKGGSSDSDEEKHSEQKTEIDLDDGMQTEMTTNFNRGKPGKVRFRLADGKPRMGFFQVNLTKAPCVVLSMERVRAYGHLEFVYVDDQDNICQHSDTKKYERHHLPSAHNIDVYEKAVHVHQSEIGQDGWPTQAFWGKVVNAYRRKEYLAKHKQRLQIEELEKEAILQYASQPTSKKRKRWDGQSDGKIEGKDTPIEEEKPVYICRSDGEGEWRKYTFIQGRYFVCKMMELQLRQIPLYLLLEEKLANGLSLELILPFNRTTYPRLLKTPKLLHKLCFETIYKCENIEFLAQYVLFCMLTLSRKELPWEIYYRQHRDVYPVKCWGFSLLHGKKAGSTTPA